VYFSKNLPRKIKFSLKSEKNNGGFTRRPVDQRRTEGGGWGCSTPPPKYRRYRWSPRSHEQEEPASRFPFAVHCVLIRL